MESISEILDMKDHLDEQIENLTESFGCADISSNCLNQSSHPAFKNGLILGVVFSFLNFEELKQCRAVNKCWKSVSQPIFRRKMHVVFRREKTPHRFLLDFQENQIECGRYIFNRTECLNSDFLNVFRRDSSELMSLELNDVAFNDENGKIKLKFDLSDFLEQHKMLKHLKVSCPPYAELLFTPRFTNDFSWLGFTMMMVSQEKLLNIEYLHLLRCVIILGQEKGLIRCAPKEIELNGILFLSPAREILKRVVFNDIFDTKNLDKITIWQYGMEYFHLNLPNTINHTMSLARLYGVTFTVNPDFKLKCLYVGNQDIDISILPNSLEMIHFELQPNQHIYESSPLFSFHRFSKLKALGCSFSNQIPPTISKFSTCPLQFVRLEKETNNDVPCNLNWLPSTVNTLVLGNINEIWREEEEEEEPIKLNVNTLIVHRNNNSNNNRAFQNSILKIARRIKSTNLCVIFHYYDSTVNENSLICRTILEEKLFSQYFIVGGFKWYDDDEFLNDPLSRIVSKRSSCYAFDSTQRERDGLEKWLPKLGGTLKSIFPIICLGVAHSCKMLPFISLNQN